MVILKVNSTNQLFGRPVFGKFEVKTTDIFTDRGTFDVHGQDRDQHSTK